jgi:hypothetical protein
VHFVIGESTMCTLLLGEHRVHFVIGGALVHFVIGGAPTIF